MENFAKDFVALLQFLLPGFVAAWVFYGLTSYPKPSQFERVVQALIFTAFIQCSVYSIKPMLLFIANYCPLFTWNKNFEVICSLIISIILGLIFSYFANTDKLHKLLRKFGITRETSYPSEWFGVFLKNVTYVVLHLDGERRLYGWPIEWPSEPNKGHFVLVQASWLDGEKEIPLDGVEKIVVDSNEVKMIEFMTKTWEEKNGQERF
jgi:hypothetical protein